MSGRRPRGPADPGRRDRLADAALLVATRDGLAAVSHRAVAREAGVPLGSTTYHYADLDELVAAAMARGADAYREELAPSLDELADGGDPAEVLTRSILDYLGEDGRRAAVESELYAAAARREGLRDAAVAWAEVLPRALEPHLGATAADAVSTLLDGACLRAALTGAPPDAAELRRRIGRLLSAEDA